MNLSWKMIYVLPVSPPKFYCFDGMTVARIDSIINIGDEEEPISYERHPIYVCLESDYEKVKHLDD